MPLVMQRFSRTTTTSYTQPGGSGMVGPDGMPVPMQTMSQRGSMVGVGQTGFVGNEQFNPAFQPLNAANGFPFPQQPAGQAFNNGQQYFNSGQQPFNNGQQPFNPGTQPFAQGAQVFNPGAQPFPGGNGLAPNFGFPGPNANPPLTAEPTTPVFGAVSSPVATFTNATFPPMPAPGFTNTAFTSAAAPSFANAALAAHESMHQSLLSNAMMGGFPHSPAMGMPAPLLGPAPGDYRVTETIVSGPRRSVTRSYAPAPMMGTLPPMMGTLPPAQMMSTLPPMQMMGAFPPMLSTIQTVVPPQTRRSVSYVTSPMLVPTASYTEKTVRRSVSSSYQASPTRVSLGGPMLTSQLGPQPFL